MSAASCESCHCSMPCFIASHHRAQASVWSAEYTGSKLPISALVSMAKRTAAVDRPPPCVCVPPDSASGNTTQRVLKQRCICEKRLLDVPPLQT